jgi:hypothetical protein
MRMEPEKAMEMPTARVLWVRQDLHKDVCLVGDMSGEALQI